MANPRARPPAAVNTTSTEYYLPQHPPSWIRPSICTQPDFHSLNSSLDLLFVVNQHLRRHPLNTDPMPCQTYFQDQRAYNLLYRMRGDLQLMDRLIDSLYQARRLLQFVTPGPGLPGQYRINPTAELTSKNLATLHNTPPGFPLPHDLPGRSPSPAPRTPPQLPPLLDRPSTTGRSTQHCYQRHSPCGALTLPRLTPTVNNTTTLHLATCAGLPAHSSTWNSCRPRPPSELRSFVVFDFHQQSSASTCAKEYRFTLSIVFLRCSCFSQYLMQQYSRSHLTEPLPSISTWHLLPSDAKRCLADSGTSPTGD